MRQAFSIYSQCRKQEHALAKRVSAAQRSQTARPGAKQLQPSLHVKQTVLQYQGPLSSASFTNATSTGTRKGEYITSHPSSRRPKTAGLPGKTSCRRRVSRSLQLRKTAAKGGTTTPVIDEISAGRRDVQLLSPRSLNTLAGYPQKTDIDNGVINAVGVANGLDTVT